MKGNSSVVHSNQSGIHPALTQTVARHLGSPFLRPLAEHSQSAFQQACDWLAQRPTRPLVLDSGCGVGESTRQLALRHPQAWVIGIDKSAHRLARCPVELPGNSLLLRSDLNDFWRLACGANWRLSRHYLLYPNPWPKASHLRRRWYGAPVFPSLLQLGGTLEVRSNWQLYVKEFALALQLAGKRWQVAPFSAPLAITPFERKYWASGQPSWQLLSDLD